MKSNIYVNRKLQYRQFLELGLIISLASHIFLFQGLKKLDLRTTVGEIDIPVIDVIATPITRYEKTMPPNKPTTVIPSEDGEIPETETIPPTGPRDWPDMGVPLPPPPLPEDPIIFKIYDLAPTPIGGYATIVNNLIYPEMAKMIGIEGTVIVQALIDEKGVVRDTQILKSLGSYGCDEAAENAVRATKWNPAYQRDMPVKVWISIPITFKLANNK